MKTDREARMTIKHLAAKRLSNREIARLLGIVESSVRYHRIRLASGATDGRSEQCQLAEDWSEAIAHYIETIGADGPANLAALHDYLVREHDYRGSLGSVQRYYRKHFARPKRRARRQRRYRTVPSQTPSVRAISLLLWPFLAKTSMVTTSSLLKRTGIPRTSVPRVMAVALGEPPIQGHQVAEASRPLRLIMRRSSSPPNPSIT